MEDRIFLELNDGIKVINARIIDLNNKKLKIEKEIREKESIARLERKKLEKDVNLIRRCEYHLYQNLKPRLEDLKKMIRLNQNLLCQSDEHEYQLEN